MNCANSIKPHCTLSTKHQLSVPSRSAYVYRVCLVKDHTVSLGKNCTFTNASQAQAILKNLILTRGQPDREQFVVTMLNTKNDLIGFNIVSVGSLAATTVHPCGVLKPAILANAASIVMCHNHPSGDPQPSEDDRLLTWTIIQAADVVGIRVLDHLIITGENDQYFSFADQGLIAKAYLEVGRSTIAHRVAREHLFEKIDPAALRSARFLEPFTKREVHP